MKRLKEWAFAGFTFDFIFASISVWAVDGWGTGVLLVLMISYFTSSDKI